LDAFHASLVHTYRQRFALLALSKGHAHIWRYLAHHFTQVPTEDMLLNAIIGGCFGIASQYFHALETGRRRPSLRAILRYSCTTRLTPDARRFLCDHIPLSKDVYAEWFCSMFYTFDTKEMDISGVFDVMDCVIEDASLVQERYWAACHQIHAGNIDLAMRRPPYSQASLSRLLATYVAKHNRVEDLQYLYERGILTMEKMRSCYYFAVGHCSVGILEFLQQKKVPVPIDCFALASSSPLQHIQPITHSVQRFFDIYDPLLAGISGTCLLSAYRFLLQAFIQSHRLDLFHHALRVWELVPYLFHKWHLDRTDVLWSLASSWRHLFLEQWPWRDPLRWSTVRTLIHRAIQHGDYRCLRLSLGLLDRVALPLIKDPNRLQLFTLHVALVYAALDGRLHLMRYLYDRLHGLVDGWILESWCTSSTSKGTSLDAACNSRMSSGNCFCGMSMWSLICLTGERIGYASSTKYQPKTAMNLSVFSCPLH
jgi:hypothetical protein